MKDKMVQMRAEEMMKRFQKRDKLLAIKEAEKKQKAAMKRRGESEHQQRLVLKQEHARQVISERTKRLQQRLAEKTLKVKQIQAEKKAAVEAKRIRKALRTKQRLANAERARKEAAYRKSLAIRKIHASWKRMEKLKEIEEAIRIERGKQRKQEIIARHKWKAGTVLERSITPGPGQYHNNKTDMVNTAKGAKWGEQQPKSEIDWIMYRAGQIPWPRQLHSVRSESRQHQWRNMGTLQAQIRRGMDDLQGKAAPRTWRVRARRG